MRMSIAKFRIRFTVLLTLLVFFCFSQSEKAPTKTLNICSNISDEFAPSLSADGRTLIYQSNKDGVYKLYESRLQSNGLWSEPLPLTEINNFGKSKDLVAGPSISYDGNMLYFCASYESGMGNLDIYYSVRNGDSWSKPTNLGKPINSSDYEGFPCISADGKKLYFTKLASDKVDGLDCFKIMVSEKDAKGKWMTPKELPPPVNLQCDKAPRIMSDNKTLLFASVREGGKGKFDLYTSKLNEAGEWSQPLAFDFVNSPDFEQYATVPASGDYMFFHNNGNIVSVSIPFQFRQNKNIAVQGFITDLDTKQPLEASITVKDAGTTEILSVQTNNASDGRYTVVLTAGKKYELTFSKPGFSVQTLEYDLTDLKEYKEYEANIALYSKINYELSVIDYELFFPLNADISIKNSQTNELIKPKFTKNPSGSITYEFPLGVKYSFDIKHAKYADYSFQLDLTGNVNFKEFHKQVEMSPFKKQIVLNVTDFDSGNGLPVDLIITNLDLDEQFVSQVELTRDGKHAINLREGGRYKVEVRNPQGYAFYNTTIDVDAQGKAGNINIGLLALKPGARLLLKDIVFEYNSYELKEESFDEVNRVVKLMKQNPNMVVEVAAHTDNIGSDVFNKKLSDKRAKFVVDYMSLRQINIEKLKANGYGKNAPIVPNDTEVNRAKNRRLELKIISN
jgi:outer membrane protein OmpA-like peptidoglycan-associated protein